MTEQPTLLHSEKTWDAMRLMRDRLKFNRIFADDTTIIAYVGGKPMTPRDLRRYLHPDIVTIDGRFDPAMCPKPLAGNS